MPSAVRQNTTLSRFELDADGTTAFAAYRLADGVMTFTHTEVSPRLRGRGIASRLVRGALEAARAQGFKVVPRCSFVADYLVQHPEFSDLRS
jgi:uncharacterized protein